MSYKQNGLYLSSGSFPDLDNVIFINDYLIPKIGYYKTIIEYELSYLLYHSKEYIFKQQRIDNTTKLLGLILGKFNNI